MCLDHFRRPQGAPRWSRSKQRNSSFVCGWLGRATQARTAIDVAVDQHRGLRGVPIVRIVRRNLVVPADPYRVSIFNATMGTRPEIVSLSRSASLSLQAGGSRFPNSKVSARDRKSRASRSSRRRVASTPRSARSPIPDRPSSAVPTTNFHWIAPVSRIHCFEEPRGHRAADRDPAGHRGRVAVAQCRDQRLGSRRWATISSS